MLKETIIVGPCSAESEKQLLETAEELKKRKIRFMRASLWKPRTAPGFDGVKSKGFPWFAKITKMGIFIGTEVMLPEHVIKLTKEVEKRGGDPAKLFFWLGSRNQNHFIQKKIAKTVELKTPKNTKLIIKNQPWKSKEHWLGIVQHVLSSKIKKERLILCHRGFHDEKNKKIRNTPDFKMANDIKKELGNIPMIIDYSHIGGNYEGIKKILLCAQKYTFDGKMIEVHPLPKHALTDKNQQISFEEFDKLNIN